MNNKQRAIEWAEYVLPIFEKQYPADTRPRKAIEAAKKVAYAAYAAASYAAADAAVASAAVASAADADAAAASYAADAAVAYAAYAAASYAAADADAADADAAYAASAVAVASAASAVAAYAASAVIRGRHGEDKLLIAKVNLLWKLGEQLELARKIEWLEHKPTEVWQVLLKERW